MLPVYDAIPFYLGNHAKVEKDIAELEHVGCGPPRSTAWLVRDWREPSPSRCKDPTTRVCFAVPNYGCIARAVGCGIGDVFAIRIDGLPVD